MTAWASSPRCGQPWTRGTRSATPGWTASWRTAAGKRALGIRIAEREPLQRRAALGIEAGDPACELAQRQVAVLGDERGDVRLRARARVLVARDRRRVAVDVLLLPALEQPFA